MLTVNACKRTSTQLRRETRDTTSYDTVPSGTIYDGFLSAASFGLDITWVTQ